MNDQNVYMIDLQHISIVPIISIIKENKIIKNIFIFHQLKFRKGHPLLIHPELVVLYLQSSELLKNICILQPIENGKFSNFDGRNLQL